MSKVLSIAHDGGLFQVLFTRLGSYRLSKDTTVAGNALEDVNTVRCEILDPDMQIIADGVAVKAEDDEVFSFARGLWLSLARALDTLELVFGWSRAETAVIVDALYANYPKARPDTRNVCGCQFNFTEHDTNAEIARQILPYVDKAPVVQNGVGPVAEEISYTTADTKSDYPVVVHTNRGLSPVTPPPFRSLNTMVEQKARELGIDITYDDHGSISDETLFATIRAGVGTALKTMSGPLDGPLTAAEVFATSDTFTTPRADYFQVPGVWRRVNTLSDGTLWLSARQLGGWMESAGRKAPHRGMTETGYLLGKYDAITADWMVPTEAGILRIGKWAQLFMSALGADNDADALRFIATKMVEFAGHENGKPFDGTVLTPAL